MMIVPITTDTLNVPLVQTGCLTVEFDSTYPVHLNGIISQDEYRQSISKINLMMRPSKMSMVLSIIYFLSMIGGIICLIVGGVSSMKSRSLFIAGMVLIIVGSFFSSIGCGIIYHRRMARLRQAIAEESIKYSSRSPVPCSWRLIITNHYYFGGYGNRHNNQSVSYRSRLNLVIDIGRPAALYNQAYYNNRDANELVSFSGQINY